MTGTVLSRNTCQSVDKYQVAFAFVGFIIAVVLVLTCIIVWNALSDMYKFIYVQI